MRQKTSQLSGWMVERYLGRYFSLDDKEAWCKIALKLPRKGATDHEL